MDITPIVAKNRKIITGYGNGGFKINNEYVAGSLIVFADRTLEWKVSDAAALTPADFAPVMESGNVDLLLVGTGAVMTLLPAGIAEALKAKKITAEAMDTGAACRTYNVLLSEERRVAAALIAV